MATRKKKPHDPEALIQKIAHDAYIQAINNNTPVTAPDINRHYAKAIAEDIAKLVEKCLKDEYYDIATEIRSRYGVTTK